MIKQIRTKSEAYRVKDDVYSLIKNIKEFTPKERKELAQDAIDNYLYYLETSFVFLDYEDNKLAGVLLIEKDLPKNVYDINLICVDKQFRGKHIATNLINHFVNKRKGLFIIETESVYYDALALYFKLGFKEEARIKDFWRQGSDKIILTLRK